AHLVLKGRRSIRYRFDGLSAEHIGCPVEQRDPVVEPGVSRVAGQGLDASRAGPDRSLAGDDEAADLARGPTMRPAAQLEAVVLDADRSHPLAVLVVEERVGAAIDRLLHPQEFDGHGSILADDPPDLRLDLPDLLARQPTIER